MDQSDTEDSSDDENDVEQANDASIFYKFLYNTRKLLKKSFKKY